jgi:hypothetical protein
MRTKESPNVVRARDWPVWVDYMPSPGDSANLRHNLKTLADLVTPGSKLSYSPGAGRFSIDQPGRIQGAIRWLWNDSITSEEYFGEPIREVFAAAHAEGRNVTAALNGLDTLRASYSTDPAKLGILNAVIEDARRGVRKDSTGAIQLRQSCRQYLKFGLSQAMFLPESNRGVCYSFTVHWARRILLGKANFGVSKNSLSEKNPLTLDAEQKTRIMKKVNVIRPMHAELDRSFKGNPSRGKEMMALAAADERFKKYGNLDIGIYGNEQQVDVTASGSKVMESVLVLANKCARVWRCSVFLLNLRKGTGGHTIGIHLDGALHFFDSNVGEFAFPIGSEGDLENFLNRWWKLYDFDHFAVEGVSTKHV